MSAPEQVPASPTLDDILRIPTARQQVNNLDVSTRVDNAHQNLTMNETIENESKQSSLELHQDRMFFFRDQTKFLAETEWRYQPIDVLTGCLPADSRFP